MTLAPFTAHIKIVPHRGEQTGNNFVRRGGRFTHWRDMQKLSIQIYEQLQEDYGTEGGALVLPIPGGGQNQLSGRFGSIANGGAVKPQIGQQPALVMVEGFYNTDTTEPSDSPHHDTQYIHSNEVVSGQLGPQPWLGIIGLPTADVESEVIALKTIIETAISDIVDDTGEELQLFRLLYKGITFGDRGHFFPR